MVRAFTKLAAASGASLLLTAAAAGPAAARRSVHCPTLPGQVIAASPTVEVTRSRVPGEYYGQDEGGYVFRTCAERGGSWSPRSLFTPGAGDTPTVIVAGDVIAMRGSTLGVDALYLFSPVRDAVDDRGALAWCRHKARASGTCTAIREFALDRLGRVAWIESYTRAGAAWSRLRVREQDGTARTIARHRGAKHIAGVRLVGDSVRWSAGGRRRTAGVLHPACRLSAKDLVIAKTRDLVVASRPAYPARIVRGCSISDGRWRELLAEYTESSHGTALVSHLVAGTWVALNYERYPEADGTFLVTDLRSGRTRSDRSNLPAPTVDALAPDGRFVFHAVPAYELDVPLTTQLYAARPDGPDVQLDEGGPSLIPGTGRVRVFTDVQIDAGRVSWKNAGVPKSAPLP